MQQHNIQPLLNKTYTKAVRAQGAYIYDEQGKSYLDGSSGAVTCSLGHSHPKMIDAMKAQLGRLQYVYRSQFASREAEQLAQRLCEISPDGHFIYSFFVNSGSEAMETAMKIAIQYWQEQGHPEKIRFIRRRKSYHGITLGALSLSGHETRRARFESSLLQYNTLNADPESASLEEQLRELKDILEIGTAETAAFVAEPIVGAAGTAVAPPPGYYEGVRHLCDQHKILFIADEVMTGIGRTGSWFGLNHWAAKADLIAIGKSLGAGYAPIAAVMVPDHILAPIRSGSGLIMSGHTYSGHPLSCAAASKVIDIIKEDELIEKVQDTGIRLKEQLTGLKDNFDCIVKVRGHGLLLGFELDPSLVGSRDKLINICFKNGLLIYPSVGGLSGKEENGCLVAPPFIIDDQQCEELIDKLTYAFDTLEKAI